MPHAKDGADAKPISDLLSARHKSQTNTGSSAPPTSRSGPGGATISRR